MQIKGVDNQIVDLHIINYQFPDTMDKEYDGNWLNIYINVKSKVGNWQTTDPSLLTWEVKELINWFNDLANDIEPKWIDQEFIEPNISINLLSKHDCKEKKFKIKFDLESRPKSAKDNIEYSVDFFADKQELSRLANELQNDLDKFPERK